MIFVWMIEFEPGIDILIGGEIMFRVAMLVIDTMDRCFSITDLEFLNFRKFIFLE